MDLSPPSCATTLFRTSFRLPKSTSNLPHMAYGSFKMLLKDSKWSKMPTYGIMGPKNMSYRTSTPFKTIYSPGKIFRNPKNHKPPDSGMQIMAPNHGYQFTNDQNHHYFLSITVQWNCLQRLEPYVTTAKGGLSPGKRLPSWLSVLQNPMKCICRRHKHPL